MWIPRSPGRTSTRRVRGKGGSQAEPPGGVDPEPDDHGLGRSRGGFTTKVHLACEQGQKPLSFWSPQASGVTARSSSPCWNASGFPGRPGPAPHPTAAGPGDKAYGSRGNRSYLRRRGIRCTIPDNADQIRNRKNNGSAGGRPPAFDPHATKTGTRWNAASAGSNATAQSPPATTSSPSATKPPSTSPRSTSGSAPNF